MQRFRPSPPLAVSILALVAALAGTAIADPLATTSKLDKKEKKQVRKIAKKQASKQINKQFPLDGSKIADGAIDGPKIANGAVDSSKVADGSLTAGDVAPNQFVTPSQTSQVLGPVRARRAVEPNVTNGTQAQTLATCNQGETLVGGGAAFATGANQYDFSSTTTVSGSVPLGATNLVVTNGAEPGGWRASAVNNTGATRNFVVVALCARVGL